MEDACRTEIVTLHRFLVEWFTGALPRTEDAFARIARVMAEGVIMASPSATVYPREALLTMIEGGHGGRAQADFDIRIENVVCRRSWNDHAVFTYEEWQAVEGGPTGRLSSALFGRDAEAPNGVAWLHLHETWIEGHSPAP